MKPGFVIHTAVGGQLINMETGEITELPEITVVEAVTPDDVLENRIRTLVEIARKERSDNGNA